MPTVCSCVVFPTAASAAKVMAISPTPKSVALVGCCLLPWEDRVNPNEGPLKNGSINLKPELFRSTVWEWITDPRDWSPRVGETHPA